MHFEIFTILRHQLLITHEKDIHNRMVTSKIKVILLKLNLHLPLDQKHFLIKVVDYSDLTLMLMMRPDNAVIHCR